MASHEIYLDNAATTRTDPDVAAIATELMCSDYGNPSSLHSKGLEAQLRLDTARGQLATALGAQPDEIVFTSGGTEANNLAIFGTAAALSRRGKTLVAAAIEHASVLQPLRQLEQAGYTLRLVNPGPDGRMNAQHLANAVDDDTVLVSCALVNSETGAVAPIANLVQQVRRKNPHTRIHCDAVQAFCKLPVAVSRLGVDLLTVSGHKIHAPKGIGALYIRDGVRILPRQFGGEQERSLRAGTENTPLACAFGCAAEKYSAARAQNWTAVQAIYEHFVNKAENFPGVCINSPRDSTPYICSLSLPGYRSEVLLHYFAQQGIYISSGSACSQGMASHVLRAMDLPSDRVDSALRVSFSPQSTTADVDRFFSVLADAAAHVLPARRRRRRRAPDGA